ncbi:RluA family pseudouridine synthase [Oscillospiraceae bacterium WX1]
MTEQSGLLDFLLQHLTKLSRNSVKSLLTRKVVFVDGKRVTKHDYPLKPGQTVHVAKSSGRDEKNTPVILYEDQDLLVINKPAGLLSIATDTEKDMTAYHLMTDYVRRSHPKSRLFIVHRLDRETSGVLLFAKNERMKQALQDNWEALVTERRYTAVTEGLFDQKEGTVRSWLKQTKTLLVYSGKAGDGLEAVTTYRVIRESAEYSLVDILLETGRKNQIRVHMKELGHPVVGDTKYGAKTNPFKRLGLHANVLALSKPFSNEPMRFEAPVPGRFMTLFQR